MKKKLFKRFLPLCLMLSLVLGFGATSLVSDPCGDSPTGRHNWVYMHDTGNGRRLYVCSYCMGSKVQ